MRDEPPAVRFERKRGANALWRSRRSQHQITCHRVLARGGASGLADASEKEQDDAVHTTIPHRPDLLLISAERTTLGALMRPRAA